MDLTRQRLFWLELETLRGDEAHLVERGYPDLPVTNGSVDSAEKLFLRPPPTNEQ